MAESYDDDFDWGDDPFEGDLDFDSDFDSSAKQGFLRSMVTGFLSGIVEKTVGDTDARVDTLKMVLPKTWTNAFNTVSELNRRRRELVEEMKSEAHGSLEDLQYLAKRAGERLQKLAPNKIGDGLVRFSQNDFSHWEARSSSNGETLPGMESLGEGEVNELLNSEEVNSIAQQNVAIEVGTSITSMMTEVGGRTIGGLNVLNMSINRTNFLLESVVDYQRKVQLRNDAMKINLLARTYLTNAKFYKFVEASNHRMIKELKTISLNSAKSDFEKTSTSQAAMKSIRESMFNTVKTSFGGFHDFLQEKLGKTARQGAISDVSEIAGGLRMALEMTEGMDINLGSMLGNAAAGVFINNLPRLIKSNRGQEYVRKFKTRFPELGKWADDAYKRFEDLGNVASYNLSNLEGTANSLAEYYQNGFTYDEEMSYDDHVASLKENEKPMNKLEWTLATAARGAVNKGAGAVLDGMYQSTGTHYNLQRRTVADGYMPEQWNKQSARTLNEIIPEWLSQIHLSMEKLRTGDDTMKAMSYDYVKGQFITHRQKINDTLNQVFNKNEFRSQADSALRMVDTLGGDKDLSPKARNELAMQMIKHSDKKKGFSPYIYMNLDKKGVAPELADEIRLFMQKKFGITDETFTAFKEGDEAHRIKNFTYLPTEEGRELAAKVVDEASNLSRFLPDMKDKIDILRSIGRYDAMKETGVITNKDGMDQISMEKYLQILQDYIDNPDKKVTVPTAPADPFRRTRPFGLQGVQGQGPLGGVVGAAGMPFFSPLIPGAGEGGGAVAGEYKETLEASQQLLTEIKTTIESINNRVANLNLTGGVTDVSQLVAQGDKTHSYLENLVALATSRNDTLVKLLERQPAEAKLSTNDAKQMEDGKRSILEKIKNTSFRDIFNNGVDKLLDHEPLVLGGLLGGIAGMAIYNPKAAALVAGGMGAAVAYGKLRSLALARQAKDIEDLYEEGSDVPILEVSKLRRHDYFDMLTNRVIDSWEGITGSIKDLSNNTIIGAKRLAAKLFTEDNKEVFLKGLSKVREYMIKAFKWFDPVGRAKKLWGAVSDRFYQLDVYVEGEDEPALYGSRFSKGHYYVKDNDGRLNEIRGWNEITGAVYDKSGNVLITEEEYDRGLKTSMGVSINKLGAATRKIKNFGLDVLGKIKEQAGPRAKQMLDKTKQTFKADYSPIINSIDRIYDLLVKHWGIKEESAEAPTPFNPPPTEVTQPIPSKEEEVSTTPTPKDEPVIDEAELIKRRERNRLRRSTSAPDAVKEEDPLKNSPFTPPPTEETPQPETTPEANKPSFKPTGVEGFDKMASKFPYLGAVVQGYQERMAKHHANDEEQIQSTPKMKAEADDATRANSVADRENQAEKKKESRVQDAIINIAENFGFGQKSNEDLVKKKSTGLFGLLASGLGSITSGITWMTKFFGSKMLWTGFSNLFKFATIGIGAFPAIAKGIGATVSALTTLIQTKSLGSAAGDFMDSIRGGDEEPEERTKKKKDRRKKPSRGRRFAGGATKLGVGMAISSSASALEDLGVIDPDSGMGTVLDLAGTAATVYGGVQIASSLGLTGALSGVMGGVGTAVGAVTGGLMTGLGAALFNPYVLGAAAVGLAGYGVYKLITHGKDKQQELRMTQYGLSDTSGTLAEKVLKAEALLQDFVVIGNGRASLSKTAPIEQVMQLFMSTPGDKKELGEIFSWFNGRFKPVFMTYMACLDVVKIKSLKDYDESTSQDVYKVAKQAHEALSGTVPYPYTIVAKIDADTPILNKQTTLIRVNNLLDDLKKYLDRKTVPQDAVGVETVKGQSKESLERERMNLEARLNNPDTKWGKDENKYIANARLKEVSSEIERLNTAYKAGTAIAEIYVADLLPDGKPMDMLTAVRVAAYGNDENIPWRVEAVLKLERHCEALFKVEGEKVEFTGEVGELFNRFKDAFRITEWNSADWCVWFRDRFLPVLTTYVRVMTRYRKGRPGVVWKTLSATARYEIAKALVETQVKIHSMLTVSIWDVKISPFGTGYSAKKSEKVDRMVAILAEASTIARLKDPELEAGKTNAKSWAEEISPHKTGGGFTNKYANVQTADQYKNRRDTLVGGQFGTTGGGTGNSYGLTGAFKTPENKFGYQPITGDSDTSHLDMSSVTANEGKDSGVSVPRKLAEQLIIREMMKQGFTDPREIAEMLALTNYETGGYRRTTENMKYTSPSNLMKTFREVTSLEQARQLIAAGEVAIANTVYGGGKGASIGNIAPGDGYRYRGRGLVQLTGRANYRKIGERLGIDLEKNPELVSNDPNVMAAIAVDYFKNNKLLRSISQTGDFGQAATGLNGGNPLPGMSERYSLYLDYLKKLQGGQLTADDSQLTQDVGGQSATQVYGNGGGGASPTPSAPSGGGMIGSPNMPSLSGGGGSVSQYMSPPAPIGVMAVPSGGGLPGGSLVNSNTASGAGLRLKSEESTRGGKHHPGLEALANIIQSRVPNFRYFTALNDEYHVKKGSKGLHPKGLALDFTLTTEIQGSDQATAMVIEIMRQAGLSPSEFSVINEYRRKTALGTGGHIHAGFKTGTAADKFLQATGGRGAGTGQDTTGTGSGPVAPVAPTPTPPAEGAPTEMPAPPTPAPAPAPAPQRRLPPMSNPAFDKDNMNAGKGGPEEEETGYTVPAEPKVAPRAQTQLPLPTTPPAQHDLPEGYLKNKERYVKEEPNMVESAINALRDALDKSGQNQTQVLLAIHKEIVKSNERGVGMDSDGAVRMN